MSKKSKKQTVDRNPERNDDESNQYMIPTVNQLTEDESEETPSLEKHGFWLFPTNTYENIGGDRSRRSEYENYGSQMNFQPQTPPGSFFNGACCCCFQKPCCMCHMWYPSQPIAMPMQYYRRVPDSKRGLQESKRYSDQKKRSRNYPPPPERTNLVEEEVEIDGMKDMELASIVINDARSNFNRAIKEKEKKDKNFASLSPSSRGKSCVMLSQTNDTWVTNKADENFDKCVKMEKDKKKSKRKKPVDKSPKEQEDVQTKGMKPHEPTQSTSDIKFSAISPSSRGKDCIMFTQANETWVMNRAKENFDKCVKMENDKKKSNRKKTVDESPKEQEDVQTKDRKPEESIQSTSDKKFSAISPSSRGKDNIMFTQTNDTLVMNRANENFEKCVKMEHDQKNQVKKTTAERTVKFEEGPEDDRGNDRMSVGISTLATTKPNEKFEKYVQDARVENEKLVRQSNTSEENVKKSTTNEGKTEEKQATSLRRLKRSVRKKKSNREK